MPSHEAGWAHADGALKGPSWLREPSDPNALVPSLWSSTAHKVDGDLTIGGVAVNVNVGPNTTVDVAGLAKLVINEQLPVPGADKGLTVNALHLTGLGGAVDVVVASATSDAHNC